MLLSEFNTVIIMSHHRQMTNFVSSLDISNTKFIFHTILGRVKPTNIQQLHNKVCLLKKNTDIEKIILKRCSHVFCTNKQMNK